MGPGVGSQVRKSSYWARQSERVIGEYLAGVKEGTGRREVEVGLRAVYPFYERKYWPYRVWLDTVREMLDAHFGAGPARKEEPKEGQEPWIV